MTQIYKPFVTAQASHEHSLTTLNLLYEYDDFMGSIKTMADMGCGAGLDLEWWATRTTRDDGRPLNIRCTGVDQGHKLELPTKHSNIKYYQHDIERFDLPGKKFDLVWCHDTFQYLLDPFTTLRNWWHVMSEGGMLIIVLPQTTVMEYNDQAFDQWDHMYWNWTMVSLIHVLALSGFDCAGGHFLKQPNDCWLHAAVYRSQHKPADPRKIRWYDLVDRELLPETAVASIKKHGYLRQRDLILPWLDKSVTWLGQS